MNSIKPKFLYHGSQNRNITKFEPRAESIRHPDEGPVVFATSLESEASKFIVPCNDSWSKLGALTFDDTFGERKKVSIAIYNDRKRFDENDKGGSIYKFSSEQFELDPIFAVRKSEYTSKSPVIPISKIDYESGLEAMLSFHIQVFFVNEKTWGEIEKDENNRLETLKSIQSVNQERGINILEISI